MKIKDLKNFLTKDKRIDDWLSMHLKSFLKKGGQITHSEVSHIIDYLKSPQSPKRIVRMGVIQAKIQSEKWTISLNKKYKNFSIIENDKSVKLIKKYDSGFAWVKLLSSESYKREGSLMNHCVASYFDYKHSTIYSLRDSMNLPHCTIEIRDNEIDQIKGKSNGEILFKYHEYIFDFINNDHNYKINCVYDLKNLNACKIERDNKNLIVNFMTLKENDKVLSEATISDFNIINQLLKSIYFKHLSLEGNKSMKVSLPVSWSFDRLEIREITLDNESINTNEISVVSANVISKNVECESFSAYDSDINISKLKSDIIKLNECCVKCNKIITEDIHSNNTSFNKELSIESVYACFKDIVLKSGFQQMFLNSKISDYLELTGTFQSKLKFPDLNLRTLNIVNSTISEIPKNVHGNKLFLNNKINNQGTFVRIIGG